MCLIIAAFITEFNLFISSAALTLDYRPGLFRVFLDHIRTFLNAALADLRGQVLRSWTLFIRFNLTVLE